MFGLDVAVVCDALAELRARCSVARRFNESRMLYEHHARSSAPPKLLVDEVEISHQFDRALRDLAGCSRWCFAIELARLVPVGGSDGSDIVDSEDARYDDARFEMMYICERLIAPHAIPDVTKDEVLFFSAGNRPHISLHFDALSFTAERGSPHVSAALSFPPEVKIDFRVASFKAASIHVESQPPRGQPDHRFAAFPTAFLFSSNQGRPAVELWFSSSSGAGIVDLHVIGVVCGLN